jgi:methyl-accepting chemotaxis protein
MKMANFKVGSRLMAGFGLLLVACAAIGFVGIQKMKELDTGMQEIAEHDWKMVKLVSGMESNFRTIAVSTSELLIADAAEQRSLRELIGTQRQEASEAMTELEKALDEPDTQAQMVKLAAARSGQVASLKKVEELASDEKTHEQAVEVYQSETKPLLHHTLEEVHALVQMLSDDFELAAKESGDDYDSGRRSVFLLLGTALAMGFAMAFFLARSIVRPLGNAVVVANAIKTGKLDNAIEVDGTDEPSQLLESLDAMQKELKSRDEKDADFRGQIGAINRAQAVIEFGMDGVVRHVNDNFATVMGYAREEVVGKHHSSLCETSYAASPEYRALWSKLNRGEYDVGTYKRLGKGGREVWIQASYNPIADASGKFVKVVKYATDVTEQMIRNADFAGQLAAIGKSQAVIEFDMDGTVRKINENFARVMGYSAADVVGRHHSMFADAATTGSSAYREFWSKLNRGEAEIGTYKRIAKGGREMWLQSSYNPIPDANGKPFKVVKYASDVTPTMQAQQMLQESVSQTQEAVKAASDGDLTRRIPMDGKTGDLEALCRGINGLLESTADLVKRVKSATGEVQQGAEEISKGNTNLSQRTEEQASSLEETASSMEEMTSTVKQTADNAGQANQLAMAARQQAEKGGSVVGAAVTAMSGINAASKKIADIIGVIDEIAFQTNLLALNAAVEAARAGEQGRGFAVVATEVRNLAGRSATAAKEIKALIQDSVARVDEGSKLVDESGQTLEEIVGAVKKVTDIVAEIAAASREQSSGIEQVNKAVMQMDTTTQQNAALVEEAAAASQAIVEQAQALNSLVSRYNVGDNVGATAPRAVQRAAVRPLPAKRSASKPAAASAPMRKAVGDNSSEWSEF